MEKELVFTNIDAILDKLIYITSKGGQWEHPVSYGHKVITHTNEFRLKKPPEDIHIVIAKRLFWYTLEFGYCNYYRESRFRERPGKLRLLWDQIERQQSDRDKDIHDFHLRYDTEQLNRFLES